MAGPTPWPAVINLGNSIVGVSILAMPFCFKECGVLLGAILLLVGSNLNKHSCHLLLRASKATRRNSYEYLAYHTLGGVGKLAVELSIICLLIACCVAYFIIMGDLGPAIISKWFGLENDGRLRAGFLIFLAIFCIMPLSQRRSLDSISSISVISIVFYLLFTADIIFDCLPSLLSGEWFESISFWKPAGVFRGVSIFSAAFSCQTVLFPVYETLHERTVKKMEDVVNKAVSFVCTIYMSVGFFGYVLYHQGGGPKGDILLDFQPGFMSEVLRLGFTFSVALSFPLCVFPCRASIYTLFFSSSHSLENPHGGGAGGPEYIPPGKLRFITFIIVISTLCLGITIPNVEVMLGFTGATMGNLICFVFPSLIVLRVPGLPGRNSAKALFLVGMFLMTASTYDNLQKAMGGPAEVRPYKDKGVNIIEEDMAVLEAKKGLKDDVAMIEKKLEDARQMVDKLGEGQLGDEEVEEGVKQRGEKEEHHPKSNERQEPVIPNAPVEKQFEPGGKEDENLDKDDKIEKEIHKGLDDDNDEVLEMDKRKDENLLDPLKKDADERKENMEEEEVAEEREEEAARAGDEERAGDDIEGRDAEMKETEVKEEDEKEDKVVDGKRHEKEAKVIQKQSKRIKELEEMQRKQAEAIENQANALDFLLNKQKEEELLQQQGGLPKQAAEIQPQPPVPQQQDQQIIQQQVAVQQQQPVLQQEQQAVLQQQQQQVLMQQPAVQQPVLQQQQQPAVLQQQQPAVQQPVLQQQQQPAVLQQQQPAVQQAVLQQQQQPAVLQQQQPAVQQPVLQQQQAAMQQPVLQQQQQPMLQQVPILQQQQQPLLQQQQQPILQPGALQPVLQQQPGLQEAQQLMMQQQQQQPVMQQQPYLQQQVNMIQQQPGLQAVDQQQMIDRMGQQAVLQGVQQQQVLMNAPENVWQEQQQLIQQQQQQPVAGMQAEGFQQQQQNEQALLQRPAGLQPILQNGMAIMPDELVAGGANLNVNGLDLQGGGNLNMVDQGIVGGLPGALDVEKRDLQALGGNQRALQSHLYDGDNVVEDDDGAADIEEGKVGAGEGNLPDSGSDAGEVGKVDGKEEIKTEEKNEKEEDLENPPEEKTEKNEKTEKKEKELEEDVDDKDEEKKQSSKHEKEKKSKHKGTKDRRHLLNIDREDMEKAVFDFISERKRMAA